MAIQFPEIDPIALAVGPIAIRWYALAYIAGILGGWYYLKTLNSLSPQPLSQKLHDSIISWSVFGILLGGRLGYVVFYNAPYYLENPSEILMIWRGGMSFHGGLLGMITAMYCMARVHKQPFLPLMDLIACAAPVGLFFGRIANFINAELYGRATDVPWAVIFPHSDGLGRHPSQLYEAALEGALLFGLIYLLVRTRNILHRTGTACGLFLIGYALSRSFVELFREPDAHIGFLWHSLTMGQLLSLPMLLAGLYLLAYKRR